MAIEIKNSEVYYDCRKLAIGLRYEQLEEIINEIFEKAHGRTGSVKTREKMDGLNNLLTNITLASEEDKTLIVSKNRNDYVIPKMYGMDHFTWTTLMRPLQYLENERYVNMRPGYYDKEQGSGRRTRVSVSDKLLDKIIFFDGNSIREYREADNRIYKLLDRQIERRKYMTPVLLKDEHKQLMSYKQNKSVRRIVRDVEGYNEMMSGHKVIIPIEAYGSEDKKKEKNSDDFESPPIYSPDIPPIITGTYSNINSSSINTNILKRGYKGYGAPLLRQKEVKDIIYNEIGCGLYRVFNNGKFNEGGRFYGAEYQLMSKEARKKILIDGNKTVEADYSAFHINMCYHLTGKECGTDAYLMVYEDEELREAVKIAVNIALNAGDERSAMSVFNKTRMQKREMHLLLKRKGIRTNELFRMIYENHYRIKEFFFSGAGTRLQYKDSKIAIAILRELGKQDIACLCIHDSFIVADNYGDKLYDLMEEEYLREFKHTCKIKYV